MTKCLPTHRIHRFSLSSNSITAQGTQQHDVTDLNTSSDFLKRTGGAPAPSDHANQPGGGWCMYVCEEGVFEFYAYYSISGPLSYNASGEAVTRWLCVLYASMSKH